MWYCHVYQKRKSRLSESRNVISHLPGYVVSDFAVRVHDLGNIISTLHVGDVDTYKIDDDHELGFSREMLQFCPYSHLISITYVEEKASDDSTNELQRYVLAQTATGQAMRIPATKDSLDFFANSFMKWLLPNDLT